MSSPLPPPPPPPPGWRPPPPRVSVKGPQAADKPASSVPAAGAGPAPLGADTPPQTDPTVLRPTTPLPAAPHLAPPPPPAPPADTAAASGPGLPVGPQYQPYGQPASVPLSALAPLSASAAQPPGAYQPAQPAQPLQPNQTGQAAKPPTKGSTGKLVALIVAIVLVVGGGAGAATWWFLLRGEDDATAQDQPTGQAEDEDPDATQAASDEPSPEPSASQAASDEPSPEPSEEPSPSPSPSPSPEPCTTAPKATVDKFSLTAAGPNVTVTFTSTCPLAGSGDTLPEPLSVLISDAFGPVGWANLSQGPYQVDANGQVTLDLKSLTDSMAPIGQGATDLAGPFLATAYVSTMVPDGGPVVVGSADDPWLHRLQRQAALDVEYTNANLVGTWSPQVSSKYLGLEAEGKTWTYEEIWHEFASYKARYPTAVLLDSEDWPNFTTGHQFWVTLAGEPTAAQAQPILDWCVAEGWDRDHCVAKFMSNTAVADTVEYLP